MFGRSLCAPAGALVTGSGLICLLLKPLQTFTRYLRAISRPSQYHWKNDIWEALLNPHYFTVGLLTLLLASLGARGEGLPTPAPARPPEAPDFSWAPGNYAPPESPFKTQYFTPELRLDSAYHYSFARPKDHTIVGSSEVFRHNEFQLTHVGLGGDFNYQNVGFRIMTQFGMYSTTTPRNDASPARGQWATDNAYRYISEAYASYHVDALKGINIQTGIFMSYVGLWSYYNFDNWTYQPSYVSSNTPWFFSGARVQIFVNDKLKLEPWLVNGWQSYGKFNEAPGLGLQVLYKPTGRWTILGNQYYGADTLGTPGRQRLHTDDSVMFKYFESASGAVSKAALSFTVDAGCEEGGGVSCGNQYFLGFMAYHRAWFAQDHYAITIGGGAINNPGRYLVLVPPINGATAYATPDSSYYSASKGDPFHAWDIQLTGDWMPTRNITFRLEYTHRQADVDYFEGPGGVTPSDASGVPVNQGGAGTRVNGWAPDLVKAEDRITAAVLVRL